LADIPSEAYLVAVTNAPKEQALKIRLGEEHDWRVMEELLDRRRQEMASGYFKHALNKMNVALIYEGYEPFRTWREFWTAALQGASAVGADVKAGVSWQDYRALIGGWEPETKELRARLGYRDEGCAIKAAW
jgi:hypothetical protein